MENCCENIKFRPISDVKDKWDRWWVSWGNRNNVVWDVRDDVIECSKQEMYSRLDKMGLGYAWTNIIGPVDKMREIHGKLL